MFPAEIWGELSASASAELFTLNPYHTPSKSSDACVMRPVSHYSSDYFQLCALPSLLWWSEFLKYVIFMIFNHNDFYTALLCWIVKQEKAKLPYLKYLQLWQANIFPWITTLAKPFAKPVTGWILSFSNLSHLLSCSVSMCFHGIYTAEQILDLFGYLTSSPQNKEYFEYF